MDLSKRESRSPSTSRPQNTFREETTLPRANTDLPGLEVNAAIHGADMSQADELKRILNLGSQVGQNIAGDIQDNQNQADIAAATLDFQTGQKNDARFAKSHAYRDAWQLQGAKKMAIDVSDEITQKFNTALNDPDHPATIDGLDKLFEDSVKAHLVDEHGQPLNFITPQAKAALGNALMKLKADLMPQAYTAIKKQQDSKLFATTFHNMTFERDAGQPIGAPPGATVAPTAALFNPPERSKPIPKGWKGNQEDAIRELGMTANEAAQFLKTGKDPRKAVAKVGPLVEPFDGFAGAKPTSIMGAPREGGSVHNGEDFAVPTGTPLKAPMAGKVIAAFSNDRGGNQVRVQMADGAIIGMAHLSKLDVKKGDTVEAGQLLGLSGATGHATGPHVHMTLEKNGKKMSVRSYFAATPAGPSVVIADGTEPQLNTPAPTPQLKSGFDVEQFMASLPPSVDKGEAKGWLIDNLFAEAAAKGDASLLNGLEDSTRKDGSPSFTPEEKLKIVETRDRIEESARVDADRAKKKLQSDNADLVLQAFVDGKPPSTSWMAEKAHQGLLDPSFVYSMVNHVEEQQKADAREARYDAKQAQAEEDNDTDAMVYGMEAQRRAGDLSGATYAEDLKRFHNGDLGTGKKAAARLLRLQAATKIGQQMTEQNPEFAYYSSQLKTNFKPRKIGDGSLLILKPQSVVSDPTYSAMVSFYQEKVHSGEKPGDAYREAVQKYVPKGGKSDPKAELADIRAQIAALRAKRGS